MAGKDIITPGGTVRETHPMPLVNENEPGLDRKSRLLEQQRASSGGLSDDPTESGNPVRDGAEPFRITTNGASRGAGE